MWERQNVVWILLQLLFAVLINNADNAHNHWHNKEQDDEDDDPNDVTRKEDLAYNLLWNCFKVIIKAKIYFMVLVNECSF